MSLEGPTLSENYAKPGILSQSSKNDSRTVRVKNAFIIQDSSTSVIQRLLYHNNDKIFMLKNNERKEKTTVVAI